MTAWEQLGGTIADAAGTRWDVAIVGAGPAGSLAARQLALAGAGVLLVEKAALPRYKVCGCCLGAAALGVLWRAGLDGLPSRLGAPALTSFLVRAGRAAAKFRLPPGAAISRRALDAELAGEAIRAGARFLPRTRAALRGRDGDGRWLILTRGADRVRISARIVLGADGLGGRLAAAEPALRETVSPRSLMGLGAEFESGAPWLEEGQIAMACAPGGYAGLVRLEDGRLNIAAAVRPAMIREAGGPGAAVGWILRHAGLGGVEGLHEGRWRGTPALTRRRRRLHDGSLFLVGDAGAYAEPFTGEGIAWALEGALQIVPHVLAALEARPVRRSWTSRHRRLIGARHLRCRIISGGLRSGLATGAALRAATALSPLADLAAGRIAGRPPPAPPPTPAPTPAGLPS